MKTFLKGFVIIAFGFSAASIIGISLGLYLALPAECLTKDNWYKYTTQCREIMKGNKRG